MVTLPILNTIRIISDHSSQSSLALQTALFRISSTRVRYSLPFRKTMFWPSALSAMPQTCQVYVTVLPEAGDWTKQQSTNTSLKHVNDQHGWYTWLGKCKVIKHKKDVSIGLKPNWWVRSSPKQREDVNPGLNSAWELLCRATASVED